jgi:hypothetical protein
MAEQAITLSGFKEIEAQFLALESGGKADEIQRAALKAVGDVIKPALVAATRVRKTKVYGKSLPEGALKAAIRARTSLGKDGAAPMETVDFGKLSYIAYIVDHGHVNANAKEGRKHTPAYPFIRGVEDATRDEALEVYMATLQQGINKVLEGE